MKEFLKKELGDIEGSRIYYLQQQKLYEIILATQNKSKTQMKTLRDVILPRVALYKVLKSEKKYCENAEKLLEKFLIEGQASQLHNLYLIFDKVPCFYNLYRKGMIHEVMSKDLWEADVAANEKDHFEVDIKKCLWHDACSENDCPEIAKYFCECDDVVYADLKRIEFKRKNTLARGGNCCDFCYYKK